ncbi:MAG TPA: flagellar motor protein MotB [Thiotrichaceae bacterium]|jgi:chemotaxis protein MotB|nr:flagellar motor protein MotB [Thiotrichaceae bacterium]HIM09110.1 flagellar motor protein MotB [Gammaproteobacteria bacterium]
MSDEAPPKKEEGGGSPAWVMTFVDLMSLLMCFFVLLLSFSNMDLQKFKQIAGSMKNAFGVQREIKVTDSPKGTSFIAREFTLGRPTLTLIKEIRQSTIDESKQTVEFTDALSENEKKESTDLGKENDGSGQAAMQRQQKQERLESIAEDTLEVNTSEGLSQEDTEKTAKLEAEAATEENKDLSDAERLAELEETVAKIDQNKEEELQKEKELNEKIVTDAYKLLKALEPEIAQGLVAIKTQGNRILLRINENGSFPSGSSIVKASFIPVLNTIRKSLNKIDGRIIVAGHTDNIPIKTARFRSNWELSSSRAVTVVHELLALDTLPQERFVIEGHGDAHPMVSNDTSENRALNRRVELIIVQGEEEDELNSISADSENPFKNSFDDKELTTSVKNILEKEIKAPDQSEVDAINLQTLKDRFEKIRNELKD